MSGDTHEGLRSSVAHQHDIRGRDDALAARLAGLERTNQELQERVLNDGTRWTVYKRYFEPEQLIEELAGGELLLANRWFLVVRA